MRNIVCCVCMRVCMTMTMTLPSCACVCRRRGVICTVRRQWLTNSGGPGSSRPAPCRCLCCLTTTQTRTRYCRFHKRLLIRRKKVSSDLYTQDKVSVQDQDLVLFLYPVRGAGLGSGSKLHVGASVNPAVSARSLAQRCLQSCRARPPERAEPPRLLQYWNRRRTRTRLPA